MIIYEDVFQAFHKNKINYIVVGGIAANLLGLARATADLDILIDVSRDNIIKVDTILRSLGYRLKQPVNVNNLDKVSLAALAKSKNLKALNYYKAGELKEVDIIVDSPLSFELAKKGSKKIRIKGMNLPVISIDGLIKMKTGTGRVVDKFDIVELKKLKKVLG